MCEDRFVMNINTHALCELTIVLSIPSVAIER